MCGIAGIYNTGGPYVDPQVLRGMAARIRHRGPDAERFFVDGNMGLAHRHLRIIDLSDAAIQPMPNETGRHHLVFNGEIYNYIELRPDLEARGHIFRSRSDSETILHAYEEWGADCLHRLNGMFAFALWDAQERQLFVVRDRIGVKPLYYWWDGTTFIFASEIKALLAHPSVRVEPNLTAIAQYMNAMYTTGDQTWFRGIGRLLPGHALTVSPEGLKVQQWWDLPPTEDEPGSRPDLFYVRQTRELLESSVRLRMRSDVPLGAHLSGGIDSSAVVALLSSEMKGQGEQLRTFSGAFNEGRAYDERRYIRLVANRYGTQHNEVVPSSKDLARLMDLLVWHMDEPTAGPGILLQWAVCELTRQSGVTVINGGQGGDEAWGGYFGYIPAYMRTLAKQARKHPHLAAQLAADSVRLLSGKSTRNSVLGALRAGRRGRLQATTLLGDWAGPLFPVSGVSEHSALLGDCATSRNTMTPLAQALYTDLKWYLPALLQVEDRTSMAFSLESRAPLLDYRIIEHAFRVPSSLKMRGLTMKRILRESVSDLLPSAVLQRRDKMGMPTPTSLWFRGELYPWLEQRLTENPSGIIAQGYTRRMLNEHKSKQHDRSIELWKILNIESWYRIFVLGEHFEGDNLG